MGLADLKARIERLQELAAGLGKEVALWKGNDGLLLFVERKRYLAGIQDALAWTEEARVVRARMVRRLEGWPATLNEPRQVARR
jgi:hypothetical protein